MATTQPCPECAQGKHGNCDGTTWDETTDQPTVCPCRDRAHDELEDATTRRLRGDCWH